MSTQIEHDIKPHQVAPIDTLDLGIKVNPYFIELPDHTTVNDLSIEPDKANSTYPEWSEFYGKLDKKEKVEISRALHAAVRGGYETIGQIRDANADDLDQVHNINKRRRKLLKGMVRTYLPPDPNIISLPQYSGRYSIKFRSKLSR